MYNPQSGNGIINKKLKKIIEKLETHYEKVDIYKTEKQKDMQYEASKACGVYDVIIFAGGDGSFNEVMQGIAEKEDRPVLGYLPCGTVNDIARALKIPRTLKKSVKNVTNGIIRNYDIMKVNECYAMYCICAGAFTSASYLAPQNEKKLLGRIAYGLQGIKNNMRFTNFPIKFDSDNSHYETDTVFVLVMNGKSVAGFKINGDGSMDDGKLEVIIVKQHPNPTFLKRLRAFINVLKVFVLGYKRLKEKEIERVEGSHFVFDTGEDIIWNFDGEKGISGKINIDVLPLHISLIVPKK
jgi:diacylglycerol kinase (ATP)